MIKQVTAAAFRLKGTGWYETDFKKSGSGSGKDAKQDGNTKAQDKTASNEKKESSQASASPSQD